MVLAEVGDGAKVRTVQPGYLHDVDPLLTGLGELTQRVRAAAVARESARQLVIRKRWARRKANDGKARIKVPQDALEPAGTSDSTPTDTSHTPSEDPSVVTVLTRHIERIESELSEAKAALASMTNERDLERATSAQVDVLKAVLEAERQRTTELRAERDLERSRAIRADGLQAALEAEQRRSTELREERDRWQTAATTYRGFWSRFKRSA